MSSARAALRVVNVVWRLRQGAGRVTAIDKRPVNGPVEVRELGLDGDRQCDTRWHGGPDKAVYAYAEEDAAWWSAELGRPIPPGLLGENLTTFGLDVTGAVIGERWCIGPAAGGVLLEVRLPRTPCSNLSARMEIPRFHNRFAAARRVGAYLRVLRTGSVTAGNRVTVVDRPGHGVTIGDVVRVPEAEQMRRLLDSGIELAPELGRRAQRVVARARRARR